MSKVLFLPVSVGSGLLAGLIGKRVFGLIWVGIDDQGHRSQSIET